MTPYFYQRKINEKVIKNSIKGSTGNFRATIHGLCEVNGVRECSVLHGNGEKDIREISLLCISHMDISPVTTRRECTYKQVDMLLYRCTLHLPDSRALSR